MTALVFRFPPPETYFHGFMDNVVKCMIDCKSVTMHRSQFSPCRACRFIGSRRIPLRRCDTLRDDFIVQVDIRGDTISERGRNINFSTIALFTKKKKLAIITAHTHIEKDSLGKRAGRDNADFTSYFLRKKFPSASTAR